MLAAAVFFPGRGPLTHPGAMLVVRAALLWGTVCPALVACLPPGGSDVPGGPPATWETPGYGWPPPASRGAESAVLWSEPAPPAPRREALASGVAAERGVRENAAALPMTRSAVHGAPRAEGTADRFPLGSLPDGQECLESLARAGLRFERAGETRGVDLPLVLRGPVGGVEYWASDGRPLLLDCKLGAALVRIGPLLRRHGIERLRFSGAYVYRTTRGGRLSLHARGLALDVHDVVAAGTTLSVKKDFARGAGCSGEIPLLNRVACDLRALGWFRELLTPDDDRDHHDHFHLAVSPAEAAASPAGQSASGAGAP